MTEIATTSTAILPMAVVYLRVSTKDQAGRGGEKEGFSIPAQRDACLRKAQGMNAQVVAQFVDAGESARSANRPQLQEMLKFMAEHRVKYVIVHKVDRLARNRVDDVEINLQITQAGAQLVSCSENIDETPSGLLLHGIMSSIAEFYSQNLATESRKGMLQKAKGGGTPGMVPFGYINTRERNPEGYEVRTVAIDPDRAPWVTWLFEQYAGGEWTVAALRDHLNERSITTLARPNRPARPIAVSHINNILKNRYYTGVVTYEKVEYPGKHQALVSEQIFAEAQRVRTARHQSKEKPRRHSVYLKGSIHCGQCGEPLTYEKSRNARGVYYDYLYCLGRQRLKNGCTFRATQLHIVEELVEEHWRTVTLAESATQKIRQLMIEHIDAVLPTMTVDKTEAERQLSELEARSQKLMEAHFADAISLDDLKREQDSIASQRALAEMRIKRATTDSELIKEKLHALCDLLTAAHKQYLGASNSVRRDLNQAVFERIYIDEDEVVGSDLSEPFQRILSDSLNDDLARERRREEKQVVRTRNLSVVPEVTVISDRGDQNTIADLPAKSRRTSPSVVLGRISRRERPRGRLPWEMKEPRPSEDRGSNKLLLVAATRIELVTSGL